MSTLDTTIALINLDEAKEYLRITGTGEDAILAALVNGMSAWVSGFLCRNLVRATRTEYYSGDGTRELMVNSPPISSVTSVHVDSLRLWGASSEVDVSTNVIVQKPEGILRLWNQEGVWSPGYANIKVVYVAGYEVAESGVAGGTMPNAIRLAAKRILDHQFRTGYTHRKLDVASETTGDQTITYRDGDIPKDAKEMLLPFRSYLPSPQFVYAD